MLELLGHQEDADSFLSLWLKFSCATAPWQILPGGTFIIKCGMTRNETFSSVFQPHKLHIL